MKAIGYSVMKAAGTMKDEIQVLCSDESYVGIKVVCDESYSSAEDESIMW
jgi:hypothetical protein